MWPMLNRCNYVLPILIYGAAGIAVYNIIYIYIRISVSIQTNYDNSQPQIQSIFFWKVTLVPTSIQMRSVFRSANKGCPDLPGDHRVDVSLRILPLLYIQVQAVQTLPRSLAQAGESTSTHPFGLLSCHSSVLKQIITQVKRVHMYMRHV